MLTKKDLKRGIVYKQLGYCEFIFRCYATGTDRSNSCVGSTYLYSTIASVGGIEDYRLATQKEIDFLNRAEEKGETSEKDWDKLYSKETVDCEFALRYSPDITEHFFDAIIQHIRMYYKLDTYDGWPNNTFDDFKEQGWLWCHRSHGRVDNCIQAPITTIQEVKNIIGYVEPEIETKRINNTPTKTTQQGSELEVFDVIEWTVSPGSEYLVIDIMGDEFECRGTDGERYIRELDLIDRKVIKIVRKGNRSQPKNEVKQTNKQDGKVCKVQHKNFKITTGSRKRGKSISGGGCSGSITSGSKSYKARVIKG